MTEGIKGTRLPTPTLTPATERSRRDEGEEREDSPPVEDKVSVQAVDAARQGVEAATEEVRKLEAELESSQATDRPPRVSPRTEPDRGAPSEPSRDARDVGGSATPSGVGGIEFSGAEPPIRTPEEATRVAERVSREIVANPAQALAVNVNVAAVRALFS